MRSRRPYPSPMHYLGRRANHPRDHRSFRAQRATGVRGKYVSVRVLAVRGPGVGSRCHDHQGRRTGAGRGKWLAPLHLTVTNITGKQQFVVVEDDLPNSVDFIAVGVSGGTADECEGSDDEDPEVVCAITLAAQEDDDTATIQILVEPE